MRGFHASAGPATAAVVALVLVAGCGGDDQAEGAATPQRVAVGVVLDAGQPMEGVELELRVWPSPQTGGSATPEGGSQLLSLDTDTTDADGRFELEAPAADLSPHASGDGSVGLEIRRVGGEPWSVNTTVRLVRAPDTGVTSVEPVEGMEIDLAPDAAD